MERGRNREGEGGRQGGGTRGGREEGKVGGRQGGGTDSRREGGKDLLNECEHMTWLALTAI